MADSARSARYGLTRRSRIGRRDPPWGPVEAAILNVPAKSWEKTESKFDISKSAIYFCDISRDSALARIEERSQIHPRIGKPVVRRGRKAMGPVHRRIARLPKGWAAKPVRLRRPKLPIRGSSSNRAPPQHS